MYTCLKSEAQAKAVYALPYIYWHSSQDNKLTYLRVLLKIVMEYSGVIAKDQLYFKIWVSWKGRN